MIRERRTRSPSDMTRFSEIARVFEATKDWPNSQYAYLLASRMAHFNFAKDPSNTSWREKAEAAEKAAVEAHAVATSTDAPGQR